MMMRLIPAQQKYFVWDLVHKRASGDDEKFTGVLSEAKVDMNPHQVDAALFAFNSPMSKGAILADEVGLGKTIEAAIILSQLWSEHRRNIVIIMPASLRTQWRNELYEKFNLPSIIIERSSFESLDENFDDIIGQKIIICSYNFVTNNKEVFENYDWDLVVLDEAHKLRNVIKKGNVTGAAIRDTFYRYKKLLLTATPLQNNLSELYGLISIIDNEFFSSAATFKSKYNAVTTRDDAIYGELKGRLKNIVHRTLRKQVTEYVKYTRRKAFVQKYKASQQETELYNRVNEFLENQEYTIPCGVLPMLSLLVRKILSSSAYALSYTLRGFIRRLEEYKKTGRLEPVTKILGEDYEPFSSEETQLEYRPLTPQEINDVNGEIDELRSLVSLAENIKEESKAKNLIIALDKNFKYNEQNNAPRKALIFTESRKTQTYLREYLSEHGYKDKIVCFNGENNDKESKSIYNRWLQINRGSEKITGNTIIDRKQALVDYFKSEAEIMIATESGAEGINLQFCSMVVNYDMPWNPQRIEQRIGRCHRYGQKFDVVVINFVNTENLADCRVYELLDNKFKLFDGVFGSSDEILGAIDSGLDFEQRLNKIYNECRTNKEIEAAFNQLQSEMDEIIQEKIKQTKKTLLENFDADVISRLKIREEKDRQLINTYNRHLWLLSTHILHDYIVDVDNQKMEFTLTSPPTSKIPAGRYSLNKNNNSTRQLRIGQPLGEYIISKSSAIDVPDTEVTFDSSSLTFKHSVLEQNRGKSGIAEAHVVKIANKLEKAESIICAAVTDDGEILPEEFTIKLLEAAATDSSTIDMSNSCSPTLQAELSSQYEKLQEEITERSNSDANYELEKIMAWEEDKLHIHEDAVIELRKELRSIKNQIKKSKDIKEKLSFLNLRVTTDKKLQKKVKELDELKRECNEVTCRKSEQLLQKLNNEFENECMFRIKWKLI